LVQTHPGNCFPWINLHQENESVKRHHLKGKQEKNTVPKTVILAAMRKKKEVNK
jgi:hypothetical protein